MAKKKKGGEFFFSGLSGVPKNFCDNFFVSCPPLQVFVNGPLFVNMKHLSDGGDNNNRGTLTDFVMGTFICHTYDIDIYLSHIWHW